MSDESRRLTQLRTLSCAKSHQRGVYITERKWRRQYIYAVHSINTFQKYQFFSEGSANDLEAKPAGIVARRVFTGLQLWLVIFCIAVFLIKLDAFLLRQVPTWSEPLSERCGTTHAKMNSARQKISIHFKTDMLGFTRRLRAHSTLSDKLASLLMNKF